MAVNEWCLNQIQNWNIFRQEAWNILKSLCLSNDVADEMSIVFNKYFMKYYLKN